ncbi:MAG: peptidylprolyl isomerase [Thermoguttaceae bacterium]|nr:peptidylprolyl isomerase [Thermoguttaceae bacterium]MDW8078894.1 peptidylprolyl isomerase [Thermoguttaceae bacterium]
MSARAFKGSYRQKNKGGSSRQRRKTVPQEKRSALARQLTIQQLEDRSLMAAPELSPIPNQILHSGAPLYVPLTAIDPDGDALTFSARVVESSLSHPNLSQPVLSPVIAHNNRNLRLNVQGYGALVFELFENWAPRTTGRIIQLVNEGFYNGLTFHRIEPNFVIQGGDPTGTGAGGSGVRFDDEFHPNLMHTRDGVLSMAKSSDDTNDSQFFITLGPARHLDFNHSVFGFLVEGWDVLQQIAAVNVGQNSRPQTPVVIQSATVFSDPSHRTLVLVAPWGTTGSGVIEVSVTDSEGNTATQTFRVTVSPDTTNTGPYLKPIAPIWTQAGLPVNAIVEAYDRENDRLKFTATATTSGISVRVYDSAAPTVLLTVTPGPGAVGVHSIRIAVTDNENLGVYRQDSQLVPVYIRPGKPTVKLGQDSDTGANASDNITRLNNSQNARLKFSLTGLVAGAEVYVLIDGIQVAAGVATGSSLELESTGEFPFADGPHTLSAVQVLRNVPVAVGNFRDTVTLWSDDADPVSFIVDTVAPLFTSRPSGEAVEGRLYRYQPEIVPEVNGPVTFELVSGPSGITVDRTTGVVQWIPNFTQAGVHPVIIRAVDVAGNESEQSFSISVANAPDFLLAQEYQLTELQTWELVVAAVADYPPVTIEVIGQLPDGMTFEPSEPRLRWTPSEAQGPGTYQIKLRAVDSAGIDRETTLQLTVAEDNQPPQLAVINEVFAREFDLVEIVPVAADNDLPTQDLVFALEGQYPAGVIFDDQTGIIRWQPGEAAGPGVYQLRLRVTDGYGAWDEKEISIRVDEVYQPPVWEELGPFQAVVGDRLVARVRAVDPDWPAGEVRYRLLEGPPGLTVDSRTGEIHWNVSRQAWQAMGMPSRVIARIEAYKAPAGTGPEYKTAASIQIEVMDPWLLALASWGLAEAERENVQTNGEILQRPENLYASHSVLPAPARLVANTGGPGTESGRSVFAGPTGWLNRPTGALGVSNEVLDLLQQLEEELLNREPPAEIREPGIRPESQERPSERAAAVDINSRAAAEGDPEGQPVPSDPQEINTEPGDLALTDQEEKVLGS